MKRIIKFLIVTISFGVPLYSQNPFKTALRFDGIDDYIDCGNDSCFNNNVLTLEAWIRSDNLQHNGRIISKWGYQSGYDLDLITAISVGIDRELRLSLNQISIVRFPLARMEGQWIHIAAAWDGSNAFIYINGDLMASAAYTNSIKNSENNLTIGRMVDVILVGEVKAGSRHFFWNADNKPSGMYLIRVSTNNYIKVLKCALVR